MLGLSLASCDLYRGRLGRADRLIRLSNGDHLAWSADFAQRSTDLFPVSRRRLAGQAHDDLETSRGLFGR